MVKAKETLNEKHGQQSGQSAQHDRTVIRRPGPAQGIRQQVEQPYAQHDAGDKANGDLHAAMREPYPLRYHAAQHRCSQDRQAVVGQRNEGIDHVFCGWRQLASSRWNDGSTPPRLRPYSHNPRPTVHSPPAAAASVPIMRACVQRVLRAQVVVAGQVVGQISRGLLVFLGVAADDDDDDLRWLVEKVVGLRIFADEAGKMNRSLTESGGAMLVVSQFTLLGDCRKGRRPSFISAAPPGEAEQMYQRFVEKVKGQGIQVETGVFRAEMAVELVNDGPVTLVIDSP